MTVSIFKNVFSDSEVNTLLDYYQDQPVAAIDELHTGNINKNIDYQLESSLAFKVIRPKLNQLFGPDHKISSGCYKELTTPYPLHIDNMAVQTYQFQHEKKYNSAALIPLVSGEHFKTAVFKIYGDEIFKKFDEESLTENNDIDLDLFSHHDEYKSYDVDLKDQIRRAPIDQIVTWKAGDVFTWRTDQLHCSTNFKKYNLTKKFIVIWVS
jgi:hypothetical protein